MVHIRAQAESVRVSTLWVINPTDPWQHSIEMNDAGAGTWLGWHDGPTIYCVFSGSLSYILVFSPVRGKQEWLP